VRRGSLNDLASFQTVFSWSQPFHGPRLGAGPSSSTKSLSQKR
jgi:hypothetical protein